MVEHAGMLNHLYAKITDLRMTQEETIAQTASQCFDISVWQFLSTLLVGGRVIIFGDDIVYDPSRLLNEVHCHGVSILEIVPSMMRALLDELARRKDARSDLPALRWMIATGEELPPEICVRWFEQYSTIPLLNAYGPTECSDDVTHYFLSQPPSDGVVRLPVGRPVANMQMYVLDAMLSAVPVGVSGELHVGGVGVGRGYLNRPELTAEKFIPDPFSSQPGARLYRTGDLGRYLNDGNIEFLGRIDHQVKIRGFRIELGEIEAALSAIPDVREAVVVIKELKPNDKSLVAYVVTARKSALEMSEAQSFLKERLPEYMMPAAIVKLGAMPLTPNGKIDRRALPAPEQGRLEHKASFTAPRTPAEEIVAAVWKQIFGLERIGSDDNFFELGGHSLLATRWSGDCARPSTLT